jgi:hypothetical protein
MATRLLFRIPTTPGGGSQKEESSMVKHLRITIAGAVLLVIAAASSTGAWTMAPTTTTYLTFTRSVAIPGVQLAPGTYIFELANPGIVRVSSRDRTRVYLTTFTQNIDRPENMAADLLVLLGEASRGETPPVRAWFPEGENQGYEFRYRN